jgi:protein-disulfide isomerase/uncharacterized membrane protein
MSNAIKLPKDNVIANTLLLLEKLKIPFTKDYVDTSLRQHPAFPSLLCISDTLDDMRIENASLRIPKDKINEIDGSFIAHINERGENFVYVEKVEGDQVRFFNTSQEWVTEPVETFNAKWDGVILVAETSTDSREPGYTTNKKKEGMNAVRLPFVLTAALILLVVTAWLRLGDATGMGIAYALLLFLKVAGTITSVLLLIQTIDSKNPFTNQICQLNKKTDCNSILQSKAATVFGFLSWSEAGLFYFGGGLLALLFGAGDAAVLKTLLYLNILALPYTIYSVYYQARVAKLWCVLCLIVQGIFWLEFASGFTYLMEGGGFEPTINTFLVLLVSFLLPVVIWVFMKPFVVRAQQFKPLQIDYNRLKRNPDIFNSFLSTQPAVTIPPGVSNVVMGNPEADYTITMVTNPYCGPCADAHRKLEELLQSYGEHFRLVTIFTASKDAEDRRTKVARHMIGLYQELGAQGSVAAFHDWYSSPSKDYDVWAAKYPIKQNGTNLEEIIEGHVKWCEASNIAFTPAIFVNGHQMPETYQLEDLKYFIKN